MEKQFYSTILYLKELSIFTLIAIENCYVHLASLNFDLLYLVEVKSHSILKIGS